MAKWAKRVGFGLLILLGLLVALVLAGKLAGERKLARKIDVPLALLAVTPDPARIEHGRYLFQTRGCADCHGAQGSGKPVIDGVEMRVVAPNITRGENSAILHYQPADWVRTVRHGVKPDGTPILIMPSEDFNLTDADMAALMAYLGTLPPAKGEAGLVRLPLPVKIAYALGKLQDAAEKIDHTLPPPLPVAAEVSPAHGKYIANGCIGCHGTQLAGGRVPGAPPSWPASANLTPGKGSVMPRYPTPELFMAALRTGKRPDGSAISEVMPFEALRQMTDTDLRALYAYLKTLQPHDPV